MEPKTLRILPDDLRNRGWVFVPTHAPPARGEPESLYQVEYERAYDPLTDGHAIGASVHAGAIHVAQQSPVSWDDAIHRAFATMRQVDDRRIEREG